MIDITRLTLELTGAGLPVVGVSGPYTSQKPSSTIATWYTRPEGQVRVDWSTAPTAPQNTQATTIVAAHDGTPNEGERLDTLGVTPRLVYALALLGSSSFPTLSAVQKGRIQAIVDAAGVLAKAKLS